MKNKKFISALFTVTLLFGSSAVFGQTDGGALVDDTVLLWSLISLAAILAIANLIVLGTIKSLASDKNVWAVIKEKSAGASAKVLVPLALLGATQAYAQDGATAAPFIMGTDLFYALLAMNGILLFLLFYQVGAMRSMVKAIKGTIEDETVEEEGWTSLLTDNVPIEREEEIMFEHEHDGIRELDNNLPPWWLYGFYVTILFAVLYTGYYIFGPGINQHQEFEMAMEKARIAKELYMSKMDNAIDETNVTLITNAGSIAKGKEVYTANCAACHGQAGEGGVGPNFTDEYWIHGGGIKNVFTTVKYGVPEKGMIPWEAQLSPKQMQEVASYILSLQGTNPPNGKEPQGTIWVEEAEAAPAADSTATVATETDSAAVADDTPDDPVEEEENTDS